MVAEHLSRPAPALRVSAIRLLAGLLMSLALMAPALADWKRDYVLAERAARDGNWAEAEELFRSAARDEPEPSERKRFEGVVFREYAPHFWAGLAASRQGACRRAIDYWQDPANDAATLAKIKDFKAQQDRGLSECRQRLAQAQPATTPPPATTTPQPAPQVAQQTPTPTPAPTPAAKPPAPQPSPAPPKPKPATPKPATPVAQPAPSTASRSAPASLRSAADAWLNGRVDAVLAVRPESEADGRAKAHLYMLRAAARHMKSELGDDSSLAGATSDIRAARRAMASISPNEAFYSPSFRALWKQTR